MTRQYVEGVLVVKYTQSNYKALYGRIAHSTTYTKDYIQIPEAVSAELRRVFDNDGADVEIEYAWPGEGSQAGNFHWSTDRYHLKWGTNNPPLPWTLGDVHENTAISLGGDISLRTEADGDRQLEQIEREDCKPWLVGVKLAGEGNRLHLRVYFEDPPQGRQDRGINQLPEKLQRAIHNLDATPAGTVFVNWSEEVPVLQSSMRARKLVEEIQQALSRDPNVLLVGPPGSGKSVALEDLKMLYLSRSSITAVLFDPDSWTGDWLEVREPPAKVLSLTFHASYTYENFVAGLFPTSSAGGIQLEAVPGPLLCMSHWVGDSEKKGLLILDEFNRGSAAAIFGDTLSLLDRDKRSSGHDTGAHIQRPYSEHRMPVPPRFKQERANDEEIAQEVRIPANLHLVAAMNSTDRSVAPLDAALRRRFAVIRVVPDYEVLSSHLGISMDRAEQQLPTENEDIGTWRPESVSALAITLLRSLNERIELILGEDFLLGHGLFWSLDASDVVDRLYQLADCVDRRVVPTLRTTLLDQDEALASVLGVPPDLRINAGAASPPQSTIAYWNVAPAELAGIVAERLVLQTLCKMSTENQIAALLALASSS